jgi:hypothetical protein
MHGYLVSGSNCYCWHLFHFLAFSYLHKMAGSLKLTVDFDMNSATVTAQGRNELFYMAHAALNFAPARLSNWAYPMHSMQTGKQAKNQGQLPGRTVLE